MAHAAVTALAACSSRTPSFGLPRRVPPISKTSLHCWKSIQEARASAANLIGSSPEEIALIGPTSLGLSLFANGIEWRPGDEVICYLDDYPANVYPWLNLRSRGVTIRLLQPAETGELTPELVAKP